MSLRREKNDNLSVSKEANGRKAKSITKEKDSNVLFSNTNALNCSSKEKRIIPILSNKHNTNKVIKRVTASRKTKAKVLTTSKNIGSSPRLLIKETNSDLKILPDSLSGLSETTPTISGQINNSHQEIKLDESKSPTLHCIFNSKTTFPVDISHELLPSVSDCSISVLSHENNLDIKKNKKFTSYESTFSALSTLPNTNITLNTNLFKNLESERIDSTELQNLNLNDSLVFDQISVVSSDELATSDKFCNLQEEALSNNSLSSQKSSEFLCRLFSNAKPLLKPPNFISEQNMFCCAFDISLLKAAADECAYQTASLPAVLSDADSTTVWQNNNVKPIDLSLNLLNYIDSDLNISNSEDNESEISISSYKTADIQPEFFDLTFTENTGMVSESVNPDMFSPTLGLNIDESLCIMPENQILFDNLHVQPSMIPSTPPPKKRKKRRYPLTRKQRCRKKKVNKNTTSQFDPSVELCETCDETYDEAEGTSEDLILSCQNLNVEKKKNPKKKSHDQLLKNSLKEDGCSVQKTERYNLRRRCKKKSLEAGVVEESLLLENEQFCDTCDESDSEFHNRNNSQEKIGLVKAKDVDSYDDQNKETYFQGKKRNGGSLEKCNSSAEFPLFCDSKSVVVVDNLEQNNNINKFEPKKELENLKVKCSISLDKLADNSVKNHKKSVAITNPNNDNTMKLSHKRRKISLDEINRAQIEYSNPNEKTVMNSDKTKSEIDQNLNSYSAYVVIERLDKNILNKFIEPSNMNEIRENVYVDKDCRNCGNTTNCDNTSDTSVVKQFIGNHNVESSSLPSTFSENEKQISALADDDLFDSKLSNLGYKAFSPSKSKYIKTFASYPNALEKNSFSSALSSTEVVNDKNSNKFISKSTVENLSNIKMNSKSLSQKPLIKRKHKNKSNCNINNSSDDPPLELRGINEDMLTKSVHSEEALILTNNTSIDISTTSSVFPTEQNKSSYSKTSPLKSKSEKLGCTILLGTNSKQKSNAEEVPKKVKTCTVSRNVSIVPKENVATLKKMSLEAKCDTSVINTISDISQFCEFDQSTEKFPENNENVSDQNSENNIVLKSDSLNVEAAVPESVRQKDFFDCDILKKVVTDSNNKKLDKQFNSKELVVEVDSSSNFSEKDSEFSSCKNNLHIKNDFKSCKKKKSLSERNQLGTTVDSSKIYQSAQSEPISTLSESDVASLNSNFCEIQNSEKNDLSKNHLGVNNSVKKSPEKKKSLKKTKKNKVLEENSAECTKQSKLLKDIYIQRQPESCKITDSESQSILKENVKITLSETTVVDTRSQSSSNFSQNKNFVLLNSLEDDISNLNKEEFTEGTLNNVKNISERPTLETVDDIVKVSEEQSESGSKTEVCDTIQFSVHPNENSLDNSESVILSLSDEELDPLENIDPTDNSSYSVKKQASDYGAISSSIVYEHLDKITKFDSKNSASVSDYKGNEMFGILNDVPNYLPHNFKSFGKDPLSEDDSESDEEHSFKRLAHERKNHILNEDIDQKRVEQNEVYEQNEIYHSSKTSSVNSDDCQKSNSVCESSRSSTCSEKSKVMNKSVQHLEDVILEIKELCDKDKVDEAVRFADTYMKISSSDNANKSILRNLLKSVFSFACNYSGVKDFSSLAVFDEVLNLIHNFNLYSKQFCSYFLINCCFQPELCKYSIKMLDMCQKKNIPLTIDAISAFSSFLKSGEITLSQLLDYVDYIKSVCNRKIPKDITHLILEKSKACKFSEMHRICLILNEISSREIDKIFLEDFLVMCFKNSMWSYIADMFVKWNKDHKNSLINSMLHAFAVESEKVGKYYGKFASALHDLDEKELSHLELKIAFGSIGVCLMLYAFEGNNYEIALEILDVLHRYKVNYFDLVENNWKFHVSLPNSVSNPDHMKTLPFLVIFVAIDICLHLKRSVDAFTIFQEFKWINPDNIFDEEVRSYVMSERYQRLVKLTVLLNNKDTVDEGYEAMKILVNAVEQDMIENLAQNNSDLDEKLKEKPPSVRSIYNKYLVNLMDSMNMKYVSDLYRHSLGPKKDIFILNVNVIRGLTVAFSNHAMDDKAKCIFMFGLVKNVYSVQMTELESFPWGITIRSHWTSPEIKLVIEWFVKTLFSLLLNKPKEENFEDWFSMKIFFKKTDLKKAEGSFSQCLLETSCDINDCIKRTKEALQNMNPSLQFTENINEQALLVTPNSLYNYYWINRCSDKSLNSSLCSRPPFELRRKRFMFGEVTFSFGKNISPSLNQANSPNKASFQVPSAKNTISDWIDEICANNLYPPYTPISPKSSPNKIGKSQDISSSVNFENETGKKSASISNKMHPDFQKLSNSPIDSITLHKSTILLDKQQKILKHDDLNAMNRYLYTSPKSVTHSEMLEDSKVAKTNSLSFTNYCSPVFQKSEESSINKNLNKISPDFFSNQSIKLNQTIENEVKCDLTTLPCDILSSDNLLPIKQSMSSKMKDLKRRQILATEAKKLYLKKTAISKNINSHLLTQKESIPSKKKLKLTNATAYTSTLKSNCILKKKEIIKIPKATAMAQKNRETKINLINDSNNLTISFATNSHNRIVSDSAKDNTDIVDNINPIKLQPMNMKKPLRKLNSQSSFKEVCDFKNIAQASKFDTIKTERRNLKNNSLLVQAFPENIPNQSKITDIPKIVVKISGSDSSAQKFQQTSEEHTVVTHSSGAEVHKPNGNGGTDSKSLCTISNDSAKTTLSTDPSVANKVIQSSKPKIKRDFINVHKNITFIKTNVTSESGRTDPQKLHTNHTSFECEKKGQIVHTNKRFKSSENVVHKTENFKILAGSLCREELNKIVGYLKVKIIQKHKHLSSEEIHQNALTLAQTFIQNHNDINSLDSRAMKLLMEFTMSNV